MLLNIVIIILAFSAIVFIPYIVGALFIFNIDSFASKLKAWIFGMCWLVVIVCVFLLFF